MDRRPTNTPHSRLCHTCKCSLPLRPTPTRLLPPPPHPLTQVTATLYRWHASHTAEGEFLPYEEQVLEMEPSQLLLR